MEAIDRKIEEVALMLFASRRTPLQVLQEEFGPLLEAGHELAENFRECTVPYQPMPWKETKASLAKYDAALAPAQAGKGKP